MAVTCCHERKPEVIIVTSLQIAAIAVFDSQYLWLYERCDCMDETFSIGV